MIHYKGETGKVIQPSILGVDVTGCTITVYVLKPNGTTLLTKSGTIINASTGQVSWTTISTDIDTVGEYHSQVKTVNGGVTLYYPAETFKVDDVLA